MVHPVKFDIIPSSHGLERGSLAADNQSAFIPGGAVQQVGVGIVVGIINLTKHISANGKEDPHSKERNQGANGQEKCQDHAGGRFIQQCFIALPVYANQLGGLSV